MSKLQLPQGLDTSSLFNLRVLLRYDKTYGVHVAHCIETGSIVTADTSDDAKNMIKELLEDEIDFALKNGNLKNLFSSPASLDVLVQWINAAQTKIDTEFLNVNLKEARLREIEPKNTHLTNKLVFAKAA